MTEPDPSIAARAADKFSEISIHSVSPTDGVQWDDYLRQNPEARIYHKFAWQQIITEEFGLQCHYLKAINADNDICGVFPLVRQKSLLFGDYLISLPFFTYGGPITDTEEIAQLLMHSGAGLAGSLGCSHVEYRSLIDRSDNWQQRTDKITMELKLPKTVKEFSASLGGKRRYQCRRALNKGAKVQHGGSELVEDFYAVFSENMRDLGTPVYAKTFFERICKYLTDHVSLTVVRIGSKPVAAGFLISDGDRIEIPWGSSLRNYNSMGVNMLLYMSMICEAIEKQHSIFDFGRSSVGAGTQVFKEQWGAKPRQLYWQYWLADGQSMPNLTPANTKYKLAIAAWQHLPLSIANRLGPMLIRSLP